MSEVQWIKITTDLFDDEKIQLIESMPEVCFARPFYTILQRKSTHLCA